MPTSSPPTAARNRPALFILARLSGNRQCLAGRTLAGNGSSAWTHVASLQPLWAKQEGTVRARAKRFLETWDHLFVFLRHEGVEPINNAAVQALRPAVQWRKICFGSKSEKGERFTERILSVTRTCRMQNRNPLDYLTEPVPASFAGKPLSSLLP